jgi:hypothetical protein
MRKLRKLIKPEFFLRLGLGITFIYSGYDIYTNPSSWIGYVNALPEWLLELVTSFTTLETFLLFQGISEIILGAALLMWFLPKKLLKLVSLLIAIKLALILWLVGVDTITFRDIGLLGTALGIFAIAHRKY